MNGHACHSVGESFEPSMVRHVRTGIDQMLPALLPMSNLLQYFRTRVNAKSASIVRNNALTPKPKYLYVILPLTVSKAVVTYYTDLRCRNKRQCESPAGRRCS